MTVADLIKKLEAMPQNATVVVTEQMTSDDGYMTTVDVVQVRTDGHNHVGCVELF